MAVYSDVLPTIDVKMEIRTEQEVRVEIWYQVSSVERYLVSSRVETLKIG